MASREDLRQQRTTNYYELMMLKAMNDKAGIKVVGLSNLIGKAKASMTEAEIAWVKQQLDEAIE